METRGCALVRIEGAIMDLPMRGCATFSLLSSATAPAPLSLSIDLRETRWMAVELKLISYFPTLSDPGIISELFFACLTLYAFVSVWSLLSACRRILPGLKRRLVGGPVGCPPTWWLIRCWRARCCYFWITSFDDIPSVPFRSFISPTIFSLTDMVRVLYN